MEEYKVNTKSVNLQDLEVQNKKPRLPIPIDVEEKEVLHQSCKEALESEKKNDNNGSEDKPPQISYFRLFRFATKLDYVLMALGGLSAMVNGAALPMFALVFGRMTDSFNPTSTGDQVVDAAGDQALYLLYIGLGIFALSWIQMATWMISGERQAIAFRKEYFKAVLRQEVGWFDMINPNELSSKIATESFQIQGAIGEKVPTFVMTVFITLSGFAVGYARGWQMALVSTAALPVMALGAVAFAFVIQTSQSKIANSYSTAGGFAEQGLNAIKTIKSLTGEDYELKNYQTSLVKAFKIACKYGVWAGVGLGLMVCTMFLDFALSFWFGSKLVGDGTTNQTMDRDYTAGDIFVVSFAIMTGGFSLGQVGPCLKGFATGTEAGAKVFAVLNRQPQIVLPPNAQKITNLQGKIVFKDVCFNYPAKPDIAVHRSLSIKINPNEKTALVGESGCGKSTVLQLLLRFYDPNSGNVTVDDVNVKDLEFNWFRSHVGYVGQEPVLFATTIRENLKFGKEDATEKEMIEALKQASAWEFVNNLQNQLDTYVGNAGGQLSGGQKQRICIARAILKNPQILLLDEATSALDRVNEAMIQKTLDEISKGRTTIVIAHRLTTVKNADRIIVLDQGQQVEEGTYDQLINARGKFETLAKNQIQKEKEDVNSQLEGQNGNNDALYDKNEAEIKPNNKENQLIPLNEHTKDSNSHATPVQENTKEIEKQRKKQQKQLEKGMLSRLYEINRPEKVFFYIGGVFAIANGFIFPLSGYLLGQFVDVLSSPEASDFRSRSDLLAIGFVIVSVSAQIFTILQQTLFTRVGEGLTLRIRQDVYKKMMKMPGGWFDKPENNAATLATTLSVDAHQINGLTSNIISIQLQNLSSLVTGLSLAFAYSWRVSLVAMGVCPLMIIAGQMQAKFIEGFSESTDSAYKDSGLIIMETVTNIRTVASFSNQIKISQLYAEKLQNPYKIVIKKGNIAGITFGFSQFSMFVVYAVICICGAVFVRDYGVSIQGMFVSLFAILYAAYGIGNSNQFMGDVGAAKIACKNLFKILDSEDEIQLSQKACSSLNSHRALGNIEFRNVSFKYPTRDAQVIQNLSFKIKEGQKAAFVGPSGSGKSSILQLLLRFYENYEGQILIDGKDIRSYEIREFRRSFGVVSQEPTLFNGTIFENIKYNSSGASFDDVKEAAKKSNSLSFIESNEFDKNGKRDFQNEGSGFERKVGPKGSQISGGQKQRIAIARAVIKNPNILLLDEATSALDHENEKIIQEALNQLMKGKTSLCVAHRISTIRDSDQIFVIEAGKLVEQGTYDQLMKNKSYFFRLNQH